MNFSKWKSFASFFVAVLGVMAISTSLWAEKPVFSSGRYGGIAGAAASSVQSAESLFFNPAGLAGAKKREVIVNIAPTVANATANIVGNNIALEANQEFTPLISLFTVYKVTEKLGLGFGVYPGFGFSVKYPRVNFGIPGVTLNPTLKDEVIEFEASLGAGYKITRELSIGASWRISKLSQDSSIAFPSDLDGDGNLDTLNNITVSDLSATDFTGYRLGIQYQQKDGNWGLGVTYRSPIEYKVKGTIGGQFQTFAPAPGPITNQVNGPGQVVVGSIPPMQIGAGGHFSVGEPWKVFLQYEFTKWSDNRQKDIKGTLDGAPFAITRVIASQDTHSFRFGTEYSGIEDLALRFGYFYRTPIAPEDRGAWDVFPPGPTNAFMVGFGNRVTDNMDLDFALDYTRFAGTGVGTNNAEGFFAGEFDVTLLSLHAGLTYRF